MIVATSVVWEVGSVVTPAYQTDRNGHEVTPQPLLILRKATLDEYAAQGPLHQSWKGWSRDNRPYYYEVSTD